MASGRNRNTPGDYALEQRINIGSVHYSTEKNFAIPRQTYFPSDGLLPSRVAPENLSSNSCDIESYLRGIGANNLVVAQPPIEPDIYTLKSLKTIDRIPNLLPEDLVVEKDQRPLLR